jgi:cation:H+ antiporter
VLTTAQTLLGVAVLADLRLSGREAALLFGLFAVQFGVPVPAIRYLLAAIYALLAVAMLIGNRRALPGLARALGPQPERAAHTGPGGDR